MERQREILYLKIATYVGAAIYVGNMLWRTFYLESYNEKTYDLINHIAFFIIAGSIYSAWHRGITPAEMGYRKS